MRPGGGGQVQLSLKKTQAKSGVKAVSQLGEGGPENRRGSNFWGVRFGRSPESGFHRFRYYIATKMTVKPGTEVLNVVRPFS